MKLSQLLEELDYKLIQGSVDISINEVVNHTAKVTEQSVFVCIKGARMDSHDFVEQIVHNKAVALVVSREVSVPSHITVIKVKDTTEALAKIAAAYFGYPARKLKMIGITGTKGKTTTAYMVKQILEDAGIKTGLVGTIEVLIGNKKHASLNTTPESFTLQSYLKDMVDEGCTSVVMEVSSQGLMLNRVFGIEFDYGVFTNITPDHIGEHEHKDFNDYLRCKSLLFRQCKVGIVNIDDPHCQEILNEHSCAVETFGLSKEAQLYAERISRIPSKDYLGIKFYLNGIMNFPVELHMPGEFNVYNALAAIAVARHFGASDLVVSEAMKRVSVKGRLELVPTGKPCVLLIDYAHNAVSLEALLKMLKAYEPNRLVCLFGCGGNRDKNRRYEMGEISSSLADLSVVTSDNPRTEEPQAIIDDIKIGIVRGKGDFVEICDRREAIKYCLENVQDGDIIVLAGKGHEDYQEINGVKYDMDERVIVKEILKELAQ